MRRISILSVFCVSVLFLSCQRKANTKGELPITSSTAKTDTSQTITTTLPNEKKVDIPVKVEKPHFIITAEGKTLATRIHPPKEFTRVKQSLTSYGQYLRSLPLKPHGSDVKYYDGSTKYNHNVYKAVIDLPIGTKNLHQCADALMRLRAEYLWKNKEYERIHFNFTNGFRVDYTEWMKGRPMIVKGNKTYWGTAKGARNTYQDFWKYMELIFNYAGTLSLSKELKSVPVNDMKIGDIFIQGGSPGHAILVTDMAVNEAGKKVFLLSQSYMPAQETQILSNPNDSKNSPWYSVDFGSTLYTPEWTFSASDLKRFKD